MFAGRMADEAGRFPRPVTLEPQFAGLLPEVLLGLGPQEFAGLAARALAPKPAPTCRTRPHARPDGQRPRAGRDPGPTGCGGSRRATFRR